MGKKQRRRSRDGRRSGQPRENRRSQGAPSQGVRRQADGSMAAQAVTEAPEVPEVVAAAMSGRRPDEAPTLTRRQTRPAPASETAAELPIGAASERESSPPVERGPETDAPLTSGVRGIRRTRTLADMVQPGRTTPRGLSVVEPGHPAPLTPSGVERGERSGTLSGILGGAMSDTMPTLPRVRATPGQPPPVRQARTAAPETRPLPGPGASQSRVSRSPRPQSARLTRRLADQPGLPAEAATSGQSEQPEQSVGEREPAAHPVRPERPERLGAPRLAARVALGHAAAALLLALGASELLLAGDPLGYWLLGFVALALPGALLAYLLLRQSRRVVRASGALLVGTQLGGLAWAFVVLGPRVELALLVPAGVWLAQRLGGRPMALFAALGAAVLTLASIWAAYAGLYHPVVALGAFGGALLAAGTATLGVSLALWAVLSTAESREKSDLAARARLYELRLRRAELTRVRAESEREAEVLGNALVAALHGKGIAPITVDGALGPVAEITNVVADRLSTLQKDREDRIRQEGALRMVIRAVERGWLGLPWSWPDPSGTPVDELVALLSTPRPREGRPTNPWHDDMPTLVPLPTLSGSSGYWRSPFWPSGPSGPSGISAPSGPGASMPGMAQARLGWDDLLRR